MRPSHRSAPTLVLLFAATLVSAVEVPSSSRERAERFDRWRAALQAAAETEQAGDTGEAERHYRAVLDEASESGDSNVLVGRALDGLADLYRRGGRYDAAAPLYERSAAVWIELFGEAQPRLAVTLHNLGVSYLELERFELAEHALSRAIAIWEGSETVGSAHVEESRRMHRAAVERRVAWKVQDGD